MTHFSFSGPYIKGANDLMAKFPHLGILPITEGQETVVGISSHQPDLKLKGILSTPYPGPHDIREPGLTFPPGRGMGPPPKADLLPWPRQWKKTADHQWSDFNTEGLYHHQGY